MLKNISVSTIPALFKDVILVWKLAILLINKIYSCQFIAYLLPGEHKR